MSSSRIDLQRHARPARAVACGSDGAFAQQPVTQHRFGERADPVGRQAGPLVQLRSAQSAFGPQRAEHLSLAGINHARLIYLEIVTSSTFLRWSEKTAAQAVFI